MKVSLSLALALFCAFIGTGSSIQCYSCSDYTGSCTKTKDCSQDDACLTLKARGGNTFRTCVKYDDCEFSRLSNMPAYSQLASFTYKCCNNNLCNLAPSAAGGALVAVVCSLFAVWWGQR